MSAPETPERPPESTGKQVGCVIVMLILAGLAILCFLFLLRLVFG